METSEKDTSEKKKSGGGKLSRSETVTVRLDPQLRYLIELAARKQRRTVSSFIEWALEESLDRIVLEESQNYSDNVSIADQKHNLWDVDDADRFAKLALRYPEMLNHHEQVLWKLVRENGYLWRGKNVAGQWTWKVQIESLCLDRVREYWDLFNSVARGEQNKSVLPTWEDKPPLPEISSATPTKRNIADLDDEIPF